MKKTLILGGPGAGKTTALMKILGSVLREGIHPNRVAFVSFTRAAIEEVISRIPDIQLTRKQTPYFRTIHSLCYQSLGLQRAQVFDQRKLWLFGKSIGVRLSGRLSDEAPSERGDHLLFLTSFARATGRSLREIWEERGEIEWSVAKWFSESLKTHKENEGFVDFDDMLSLYLDRGRPIDVDVAIVDEAQDLTASQWAVVDKAFASVKKLYIAGDDDQAIHEWAGADIKRFRSLSLDDLVVLPRSHRLPQEIFDLAAGIISRVEDRYPKDWGSAGTSGSVEWIGDEWSLDLSEGSWFLLARNRYLLYRWEEICLNQGIPYTLKGDSSVNSDDIRLIKAYESKRKGNHISPEDEADLRPIMGQGDPTRIWHEAFEGMPLSKRAYYLTALKRGERLTAAPRVQIDTIHGVKGKEADNVALLTDMSPKSWDELNRRPDSEHRVFYTGMTRSKRNLFLIAPKSALFFSV